MDAAQALSCVEMTPQQAFDRAEAVAIATVVKAPVPKNPPALPLHELEVERVYKGQLGARLVVAHNPMIGPDLSLEEGTRYLLLLRRGEGGQWRTSLCNGTRVLSGAPSPEWAPVLGDGQAPVGLGDDLPATASGAAWLWWAVPVLAAVGAGLWLWRQRRA